MSKRIAVLFVTFAVLLLAFLWIGRRPLKNSLSERRSHSFPPSLNLPLFDRFVWLDSTTYANVFDYARGALKEQIEVDPSERPKNASVDFRIGAFGAVALVLVRENLYANDPLGTIYSAYTLDLKTGESTPIETVTAQQKPSRASWPVLEFLGSYSFEKNEIPDLVFRYWSCTECEPTLLLISLQFDSKQNVWKLRRWPDDAIEVPLWDDGVASGYEEVSHWGLLDSDHDGFSDLVFGSVRTFSSAGNRESEASLITFKDGVPKKAPLSEKDYQTLLPTLKKFDSGVQLQPF